MTDVDREKAAEEAAAEIEAAEIERQFPFTIKLKHPVVFADETVESLTLRRGRIGDLKGLKMNKEGLPLEHVILIASRLSGRPTKVIEMLDTDDGGEVMEIALDFFARSLVAGVVR